MSVTDEERLRRSELGRAAVEAGKGDDNDVRTEVIDTFANVLHYAEAEGLLDEMPAPDAVRLFSTAFDHWLEETGEAT